MEKNGAITGETPRSCGCCCRKADKTEPTTKQAADELEQHPITSLVDAVADQPPPKN